MTLPGAARTLRFAHRVDVKYDAGCLTPIGSVRFRLENAEISNKMFLVIAGQRLPVVGASSETSGSRGGWRIVGLLRGKATTFIFEKGANMVHGSRITSDPNAASGRAIPVGQGGIASFLRSRHVLSRADDHGVKSRAPPGTSNCGSSGPPIAGLKHISCSCTQSGRCAFHGFAQAKSKSISW
jgi:hypothetical protein